MLDVIIVVVLIIALAFAFSYVSNADAASSTGQRDITYSAYIVKQSEGFGENIEPGMNVYDSLKGSKIGNIVSYERIPYATLNPNQITGEVVKSEVEGFYDYIITIETSATVSDGATAIGNYEIAVGKEVFVKCKNFASSSFCVALDIGGGKA